MAKVSKRLQAIDQSIDHETLHPLQEAIAFVKAAARAKFDETIDVAIKLGVDPRKADQNIRGMLSLPHGTGKSIRVAVFARGDKAEAAKEAGADIVGAEDLMEEIQNGNINFERCIATPDMMGIVGRLGKILGTRGLMPNPKLGTVTPNVAEAVKAAKDGQVEYRAEKTGIIHAGIGKASFEANALEENFKSLYDALLKAKPSELKGTYMKGVSISSTMGRSLKVDLASLTA